MAIGDHGADWWMYMGMGEQGEVDRTNLMQNWKTISEVLRNNKKIGENFFFMTILQILNMCFYIFLYPFFIRVLTPEGYGLYAFVTAVVVIFITFINFGFDLPGAKHIAQAQADRLTMEEVLSSIQTAKVYLWIISAVGMAILIGCVPAMRSNGWIYGIGFLQTLSFILLPQWYYQGRQKMRVVTMIQLGFKLGSLPFIFWLLKDIEDVWKLMAIVTASSLLGGITAMLMIRYQDGLSVRIATTQEVKLAYKEAFPFFLSNACSTIKEQGIVLLTGTFLGMGDVAVFDLANKIILAPRILVSKLNDAIYPKMMMSGTGDNVRDIIKWETWLGVGIIGMVAILAPWIVLLLGGWALFDAYYVSLILSVTILSWLIVGVWIQFCIIPSGETYWITINQVIAMVVCLGTAGIGLMVWHGIYALAAGLAAATLSEIVVCRSVVRTRRMIR